MTRQPPSPTDFIQPAFLQARHADVQPAELRLAREETTIGRSPLCQVVVHNRRRVSRLHARVVPEGPRFLLVDASANGTFVNGVRIAEPHLLNNMDEIGLGAPTTLLRFVDTDPTYVGGARLVYDERAPAFLLDERPLALTPQQLRLLLHLFQHADQVCTRESCAVALWDRPYRPDLDDDALDRAISKLRRTLRAADPATEFIQTRRGFGYVLVLFPQG